MIVYGEGYYTAEGDLVDDADIQIWADVDDTPCMERVMVRTTNRAGFKAQIHLRDGDAEHLMTQLQIAIEEVRQLQRERARLSGAAATAQRCGV